jgi:hypothetical protein
MSELTATSLRRLGARAPLEVDPRRAVAIKRNVHELVIDAPAARLAAAFHDVMTEPDARFGRIDVRRAPERRGTKFTVGERFHGCLSIAGSFPRLARVLDRIGLRRLVTWFEDAVLCDYAEITTLVESERSFTASYRYLAGSPIAGESRFTITPLGPDRCRLEALFAYQEISPLAVLVLQLFAARLHDHVVVEQVERAAARARSAVLSSTMDAVQTRVFSAADARATEAAPAPPRAAWDRA